MSDTVWYHVASQVEDKESAMLWMVLRDDSGYTCRTWQLAGFEKRRIEAWMRCELPMIPTTGGVPEATVLSRMRWSGGLAGAV